MERSLPEEIQAHACPFEEVTAEGFPTREGHRGSYLRRQRRTGWLRCAAPLFLVLQKDTFPAW